MGYTKATIFLYILYAAVIVFIGAKVFSMVESFQNILDKSHISIEKVDDDGNT